MEHAEERAEETCKEQTIQLLAYLSHRLANVLCVHVMNIKGTAKEEGTESLSSHSISTVGQYQAECGTLRIQVYNLDTTEEMCTHTRAFAGKYLSLLL